MLQSQFSHTYAVNITDPGADMKVPLFKVRRAGEVLKAYACADTTVSAHTANYWDCRVLNYGTAGTAAEGTITQYAVGGTAKGSGGWAANVPKEFTLSEGTMAAGAWAVLDYDEEGTVAPGRITIVVEIVDGIGA